MMRLGLVVLVIFGVHANGLDLGGSDGAKSKSLTRQLNHERKAKIVREFMQQQEAPPKPDLGPNDLVCQSLVGYYVGTFKNKRSVKTVDAQFQVRLEANTKRRRIHVEADKWNEKYSKSSDFELDFYYGGSQQWCAINEDECSISFAKNATRFTMDLNSEEDGNFFHLLHFAYFNNSFILRKPRGKCTRHLFDAIANSDGAPDPESAIFCACCGDEYKPDELLGCPDNPWKREAPTTCPTPTLPTITSPRVTCPACPTTTTEPPPERGDITCKSVVGYYNGIFQNTYHSNKRFDVEFQIRLVANDPDKRIYAVIGRWVEGKSSASDFGLEPHADTFCLARNMSAGCSIPYVKQEGGYLFVDLNHYRNGASGYGAWYRFLYFPHFNNAFTLYNAIGRCTNDQPRWPDTYAPNTSLYRACLCCGDEYAPHAQLKCPENPWA